MNLSIENVPEDVVRRLRLRAERNHRSLQGELAAIVAAAAGEVGPMTIEQVYAEVQRIGFSTPNEATAMIREDRDSR